MTTELTPARREELVRVYRDGLHLNCWKLLESLPASRHS